MSYTFRHSKNERRWISELFLVKRACWENPCKNAGSCTELGKGGFSCTCAVGFKGKACECRYFFFVYFWNNTYFYAATSDRWHLLLLYLYVFISVKNFCDPNPCENDGICTEMDDGHHCTCKLGYKGDRCQSKRNLADLSSLSLPMSCLFQRKLFVTLTPARTVQHVLTETRRHVNVHVL